MSIRRLSAYVPLAVLVGAGVHVAAAGSGHVPGGQRAGALFALLAAAIIFALGAAFVAGALGGLPSPIATGKRRVYGTLALALAGTATYALIEATEGHVGIGGLARALLASFPLAAIVLAVSRRAEAAAAEAGSRFRAVRSAPRTADPCLPALRRRVFAGGRLDRSPQRGRAPPLFA